MERKQLFGRINESQALFALLVILAITAWFARHWLNSGFGLYEDDLTFIPGAIEADFGTILNMIAGYFSTLADQGRPLMWSWVVLFGHIGWNLGGLQGIYILAYLVWLLNIVLFVLLLRRIHPSFLFWSLGGFAYVLFSADTNQAFLFNAFGLQTAITFLLIGLHVYLIGGKWRWLSYGFLLLVFLNYETPYWLFISAPLLTGLEGKPFKKRLLENTLVIIFIFLVVFGLRYLAGEARVAGLGFPDMLVTPVKHMAIGPFVSLGAYLLRPLLVLQTLSPTLILIGLVGSGLIFTIFYLVFRQEKVQHAQFFPLKRGWWSQLDPVLQRNLRLMIAGLLMVTFAYPLTFILRPYAISGRETRVHLAGVVGSAIVLASFVMLLIHIFRSQHLRIGFLALAGLVLGFNLSFGFIIQRAYVRAWDLQKSFWRELLPLISDVEEGSAVLVEPTGLEDVLYINANTWVLPRMLPRLYHLPEEWERDPSVFRLAKFWEENIVRIPGYFSIDGTNSFAHLVTFGDYRHDKSIFIGTEGGSLERQSQMVFMDEIIHLKPVGEDILSTLETRPLYDLMILAD